MIYHDGWYCPLTTHNSCRASASSGYNIHMVRARKMTGPFLDNISIDKLESGSVFERILLTAIADGLQSRPAAEQPE